MRFSVLCWNFSVLYTHCRQTPIGCYMRTEKKIKQTAHTETVKHTGRGKLDIPQIKARRMMEKSLLVISFRARYCYAKPRGNSNRMVFMASFIFQTSNTQSVCLRKIKCFRTQASALEILHFTVLHSLLKPFSPSNWKTSQEFGFDMQISIWFRVLLCLCLFIFRFDNNRLCVKTAEVLYSHEFIWCQAAWMPLKCVLCVSMTLYDGCCWRFALILIKKD